MNLFFCIKLQLRNICNLRHILCFPICDGNEVIGVAELCNKQSGAHFTKFDEEMAMAFRYLLHLAGGNIGCNSHHYCIGSFYDKEVITQFALWNGNKKFGHQTLNFD